MKTPVICHYGETLCLLDLLFMDATKAADAIVVTWGDQPKKRPLLRKWLAENPVLVDKFREDSQSVGFSDESLYDRATHDLGLKRVRIPYDWTERYIIE